MGDGTAISVVQPKRPVTAAISPQLDRCPSTTAASVDPESPDSPTLPRLRRNDSQRGLEHLQLRALVCIEVHHQGGAFVRQRGKLPSDAHTAASKAWGAKQTSASQSSRSPAGTTPVCL